MHDAAQRLRALLRGNAQTIAAWLNEPSLGWPLTCLGVILLGCGAYGATIGLWQSPQQSLYTAIKLPLLILATTAGNAMLNGMLAQLLGSGLGFRQTSVAILFSYTLAAMILGALAPVALFALANTPPLDNSLQLDSASQLGHTALQIVHVGAIAFAGIVANVRLYRLLAAYCQSTLVAMRTLLAWLAGNLLLGSQIAWVLRPFVGTPGLPVEFLRPDALRGNFFESFLSTFWRLFQ